MKAFDATRKRGTHRPIVVGFVISLAAHVLLLPSLVYMLTSLGTVSATQGPEDFAAPWRVPEDAPVELGIDADTPSSTFTWIGYDEYKEHFARVAEVEQAAFTQDAAAPGQPAEESGAGEANAIPAPPGEAVATAPESAPAPSDEESPTAQEPPAPRNTPAEDEDLGALREWVERQSRGDAPDEVEPREPSETKSEEQPKNESDDEPDEPDEPALFDPLTEIFAHAAQAGAAGRTPEATPAARAAEPAPAGEPEARPGDRSDRESEPTSLIELEVRELGKPIARPGLEIKPQRPHITHLISLTASPASPLVLLRFGQDGRPREAKIVETSHDSRVDHAILASLYRWRAKGAKLDALVGDETIDVQIRILLGRR